MLVLSRKFSETIVIGPDITLTVLGMDGRGVQIGITAPPEVTILRGELRERPRREPDREHEAG